MNQKGFSLTIILIILMLVGIGVYLVNKNYCVLMEIPCTQTLPPYAPTPSATSGSMANWKTYDDSKYNFTFKYPPDWFVSDSLTDGLRISNKPIPKNATHLDEPTNGTIFINFSYFGSAFENGLGKTEWINKDGIKIVSDTKFISNTGNFGYALEYRKADPALGDLLKSADQILSTFKFTGNNKLTLVPADSNTPAAGVCPNSTESLVNVILGEDNVPQPRCVIVSANQFLKITNLSNKTLSLSVGDYKINITSGKSYEFPEKMGDFLAPGIHNIGGEIWLQ